MGMLKEFKDFAVKGNVVDLAVGVVIGAAFGAIVGAVVDHIIMPLVGMITGGINFDTRSIKVGDAELRYGMAITAIVKFIAIALFLFMVIKAINKTKKPEPPAAPAEPSSTDKLLAEIRDALKK
ncbi:MAG: large conductance mechanosensitive channel protein MscL [Chitinophagaceae bacterium]|jgi:large conductance mechanosensitive channel|nr:large conductance mechanosensitive channel protein MscL [Chitinophagaceae bacterium]